MKKHVPDNDKRISTRKKVGSILHAVVALALLAYLAVSLSISANIGNDRLCNGIRIDVRDTMAYKFVRASEIARELGDLVTTAKGKKIIDIDTDSIEAFLNTIDKIERANVVRLTDGYILITVDPMHPVMRVFDSDSSYYVNQAGKRISANARYHVDVPVVTGHFTDSTFQAIDLLPLLNYIAGDSLWNSVVSVVKVDSPGDVLLVPVIKGHLINFGTPDNFKNKFDRLRKMYTEVLPVKGWEHYDTISVKWGGQIVATRRKKKTESPLLVIEEDEAADDLETMLAAEGSAAGQSLPDAKPTTKKPQSMN